MKCKICGKRIKWDKSKMYRVKIARPQSSITFHDLVFGSNTNVYDAIDCERCGVQKIISVRETNIVNDKLSGNEIKQFEVDEMEDTKCVVEEE